MVRYDILIQESLRLKLIVFGFWLSKEVGTVNFFINSLFKKTSENFLIIDNGMPCAQLRKTFFSLF